MTPAEASNRVVLISGASSGVGRATAVALAEVGWSVAGVGRNRDGLAETAQRIGNAERFEAIRADLTDPDGAAESVRRTLERWGRIDALCNIAGYASMAPLAETTDAQWQANLQTNLSAVFYLIRSAWEALAASGRGVVLNVSSMASIDPFPGFGAYAPSKVAVNMLTRITAEEGRDVGIRALALAPGAIETPMLRGLFDSKTLPADQTLRPEEVAERIRSYLQGDMDFESGKVIPINR